MIARCLLDSVNGVQSSLNYVSQISVATRSMGAMGLLEFFMTTKLQIYCGVYIGVHSFAKKVNI